MLYAIVAASTDEVATPFSHIPVPRRDGSHYRDTNAEEGHDVFEPEEFWE